MPPSGISNEGSVPADVQVSRFGRDKRSLPLIDLPMRAEMPPSGISDEGSVPADAQVCV